MGFFSLLCRLLRRQPGPPAPGLREMFQGFKRVVAAHGEALALLGALEEGLQGRTPPPEDHQALLDSLNHQMTLLVEALDQMSGGRWPELHQVWDRLQQEARERLAQCRDIAGLILPRTQVEPRNPAFRPENCRTYHDLAHFIHEKAMQLMLGLMDRVAEGRVPALRLLKLDTPLPLNLHLVDLGDGLASHHSPVPPEHILSLPLRALWRGISHPGISWAGPVPVDMGGFLHVLGQAAMRPPERFWDKTYAIVAANYVHYACRLGYHFQSVDSYLSDRPADNYINFTFKGGAADERRRIRRAILIETVLTRLGFTVERHLDAIRARFRRRPLKEMEERLDLLGRLMAYVRQMDMLMKDDDAAHTLAERFLAGHYERPGAEDQEAG